MLSDYLPVLILFVFAFLFAVGTLVFSELLGPRRKSTIKDIPYESGIDPTGDARFRFDVKFYLIAVIFILFDIEVIFMYPWAVVYKGFLSQGVFILAEMLVFIGILLAGYIYLWKKGAFEWD